MCAHGLFVRRTADENSTVQSIIGTCPSGLALSCRRICHSSRKRCSETYCVVRLTASAVGDGLGVAA